MDLDWHTLTRPRQTIVIYMGLLALEQVCENLLVHGLSSDTPAALIEQGTLPQQRVIVATLKSLPDAVRAQQVKAPTLIIVGEVVRLRDKLAWFENVQTRI
jgi:uroporphyrin-III C-methyltransferase/precorrin-2 dehydrogenase/sirohydrochlorin ferrochelatase